MDIILTGHTNLAYHVGIPNEMKRLRSPSATTITERTGVHAVASLFTEELGWLFREQSVADFGVDAIVEVVDDDGPSGKLVALQIKSGKSFFAQATATTVTYRGDLRHLEYWTRHSLPVFLILYNPEDKTALWQRVERRLCKVGKASWTIHIPKRNVLSKYARQALSHGLAGDDEARRRFAFSIDLDMMPQFESGNVRMTWEHWVNKGLALRNAQFVFPDGTKENASGWYPTSDINLVMERLYPWLGYRYGQVEWEVSGEANIYTLHVFLKPAARAFLEVERYFREGDTELPPEPPEQEEEDGDEAWRPKWYLDD